MACHTVVQGGSALQDFAARHLHTGMSEALRSAHRLSAATQFLAQLLRASALRHPAQVEAETKAQELAQVKAAYEETKARLRKAEDKVRLIMDRYICTRPHKCCGYEA